MKQLITLVFAGMIGGAVTLSGFFLLHRRTEAPTDYRQFARQVSNVNVRKGMGYQVPFDFTEAAAKSTPAVVHISAKESKKKAQQRSPEDPWSQFFGDNFLFNFGVPREGTGSGVIYSSDGYIITNNHVVEFADELEVTTSDNEKYEGTVIGTYPESDLAVIKIKGKGLPTLQIANSDASRIGEWVLAVGNPLDLTSTVTAGIISAKGRNIHLIQGRSPIESFIQTDAAVNPGNSGGALVDASGRLLGINTAIATKTGYFEGYSFAIPINLAVKIVDDIIKNGSFQRGYLGINIADVDKEIVDELNLSGNNGVLVESLVEGGAGHNAGLLPNDVIIEADGKTVKSSTDLIEAVGGKKSGDSVSLTVIRDKKKLTIPLVLKAEK